MSVRAEASHCQEKTLLALIVVRRETSRVIANSPKRTRIKIKKEIVVRQRRRLPWLKVMTFFLVC